MTANAFFADLGHRIQTRWNAVNADEERFADIAREELGRTPPRDHLDTGAFVRAFLSPAQPAVRQFAPLGAFGEPGITGWYGRGFVIDVYFWNNCAPAIHDHPFSGVFSILRGFSLHRTYDFKESERLGAYIRLGEIVPRELSLLREGDVAPFSQRGHALVHTLIHVPNPSISLVARTTRVVGYHRYFPPSVAMEVREPDDPVGHQLMLLEWIRNAGDPEHETRLAEYLAAADFETTFRAISAAFQAYRVAGRTEALFAMIGAQHRGHAAAIASSMTQAYQLQDADAFRQQLTDDDDRLVASALMCAVDRNEVFRVLREGGIDEDPVGHVVEWARRCGVFDEGDAFSPRLVERLLAGDALDQIVSQEAERFPEILEGGGMDRVRAVLESSILRPLAT